MDQKIDDILKGCVAQHRTSQKQLYKLYYSYSMSIAIRYIQDQQIAELAVNDSFMKVFTNIKKFDLNKSFKPWLRQILVNTSIDHIKKKNKYRMNTNISEAENISERENILSSISYDELLRLVHKLSDAYRTVFNMYAIDGYKHDEIANKLGISIGTSKSNLSKARAKLRDMISKQLIVKNDGQYVS